MARMSEQETQMYSPVNVLAVFSNEIVPLHAEGQVWVDMAQLSKYIFKWSDRVRRNRFKELVQRNPEDVRYSQSLPSEVGTKRSDLPSLQNDDGTNRSVIPVLQKQLPKSWLNSESTTRWVSKYAVYFLAITESKRDQRFVPFANYCMRVLDHYFEHGSVSVADVPVTTALEKQISKLALSLSLSEARGANTQATLDVVAEQCDALEADLGNVEAERDEAREQNSHLTRFGVQHNIARLRPTESSNEIWDAKKALGLRLLELGHAYWNNDYQPSKPWFYDQAGLDASVQIIMNWPIPAGPLANYAFLE